MKFKNLLRQVKEIDDETARLRIERNFYKSLYESDERILKEYKDLVIEYKNALNDAYHNNNIIDKITKEEY